MNKKVVSLADKLLVKPLNRYDEGYPDVEISSGKVGRVVVGRRRRGPGSVHIPKGSIIIYGDPLNELRVEGILFDVVAYEGIHLAFQRKMQKVDENAD